MVKLRDASFCNVKLFALYITVYAHLIEPQIWNNPGLYGIYRGIYFFHMPLFAFLSGVFLNSGAQCARQARKAALLYVLAQGVYLLVRGDVVWHTPYWHLWYLLSLSFWAALGWLWHKAGCHFGWWILVVFILLGCLIGKNPDVGRKWSFSRSLVFLPYFWAGLLCRKGLPDKKWLGLLALAMAGLAVRFLAEEIRVVFLYQAAPYGKNGTQLRLLCYVIGGLSVFGLLCLRPQKRFAITRAGADTLWPYILHAPMVRFLWGYSLHPLLLGLIPAMYLYILYKIRQWHAPMYGIVRKR